MSNKRITKLVEDYKNAEYGDERDGDAVVWLCPTCTHENWVSLDVVGHAFSRAVSTKEG